MKTERLNFDEKSLLREFNVLYWKTNMFSVNKTIIFDESNLPKDTIILMYVSVKGKQGALPKTEIEEWLKTRMSVKKAKVIIESNGL